MGLITFILLALFALIALHLAAFVVSCLVIGFKIGVVAIVAVLIWNCIKAVRR